MKAEIVLKIYPNEPPQIIAVEIPESGVIKVCNGLHIRTDNKTLESRVAHWIETRIGPDHSHRQERAMRLFEEAAELAQTEGITSAQLKKQIAHVYRRPAGEPKQEAGGVAVCLLGWCAAIDETFDRIARTELERIEAKPIEQIRGSLARKTDADLVTCSKPKPKIGQKRPVGRPKTTVSPEQVNQLLNLPHMSFRKVGQQLGISAMTALRLSRVSRNHCAAFETDPHPTLEAR